MRHNTCNARPLPRCVDQHDLAAWGEASALRTFNKEYSAVRANSRAEVRRMGALRGKEGAKQRRGLQSV